MDELQVFIGTSDSCDFEKNTWTFLIEGGVFRDRSGEYAILRKSDYKELLAAARREEDVIGF